MSTDLDDRLRSLGAHLDAERAAHATAHVVPLAPPRRHAVWAIAAAAVLVLGGLLAIALTRPTADDVTPATDPPTTVAPPTSRTLTLPVTFRFDDGSSDPTPAMQRLRERAATLGLDADVIDDDPTDQHFVIVVHDIPLDQQSTATRAFLAIGDAVYMRSVIEACVTKGVPLAVNSDPSIPQLLPVIGDPAGTGCTVGQGESISDMFQPTATGQALDATTNLVTAELKPGAEGQAAWNAAATTCYNHDASCPTGQLAIEYGGWIYTAPTVQTPEFNGSVQFAGSFSEFDAQVLADQINHGPAPFTLRPGEG